MSVIQISRQTSLTGRPLQDAVLRMVEGIRPMTSPLTLTVTWEGANRLNLRVSNQMSGVIDLTMGPPSTVTAQVNLLTPTAESMRARIEAEMIRQAGINIPSTGGAGSGPTSPAPAAPTGEGAQPSQPQAQQPQQPAAPRRTFDWGLFGNIMTGLFGGATTVVDAYNQVGQVASEEAVAIAQEEAGYSGKEASPIGPNTGVQQGNGYTFGQGKAVGPNAPLPGGRDPGEVEDNEGVDPPDEVGMPTWVWWAIGAGGVVGLGALILLMSSGDKKDDFRRNMSPRETRTYRKIQKIGRKTRKSRERSHPRSELRREAIAMRDAGYTVSEIAAALGINRNMVKQFVHSSMASNYGFRYFL